MGFRPKEDIMLSPVRFSLALACLGLLGDTVRAHYNMLLIQTPSAKRGQAVTVLYQWGHPYEHQLFDAPAPQSVLAIAPDGTRADLGKMLETVAEPTPEQKTVAAYRFRFSPEQRGDYLFVLTTPPIWMEEEQEYFQ